MTCVCTNNDRYTSTAVEYCNIYVLYRSTRIYLYIAKCSIYISTIYVLVQVTISTTTTKVMNVISSPDYSCKCCIEKLAGCLIEGRCKTQISYTHKTKRGDPDHVTIQIHTKYCGQIGQVYHSSYYCIDIGNC